MAAQLANLLSTERCAIVSSMNPTLDADSVTSLRHDVPGHLQLINAIAKGDEAAFERLYNQTVSQVYSLAIRITRRKDVAEEVVSDVYLQVWQQAARFDSSRGKVLAWIMVMCRTRALDAIRRNKAMDENEVYSEEDVEDFGENPQDLLSAVDQKSVIYNALMSLNESQRQLLALAFFRGYTHKELTEFTGLPLGTVKSHLRRALQNLKEIMERSENYAGVM